MIRRLVRRMLNRSPRPAPQSRVPVQSPGPLSATPANPETPPSSQAPASRPRRTLVLYKFDSCPYCRRVQRVLDQLDLEVELRDTRENPDHRRELRKQTGRTQVPCLFIDGEPMFESADIVDWLQAYAQGT